MESNEYKRSFREGGNGGTDRIPGPPAEEAASAEGYPPRGKRSSGAGAADSASRAPDGKRQKRGRLWSRRRTGRPGAEKESVPGTREKNRPSAMTASSVTGAETARLETGRSSHLLSDPSPGPKAVPTGESKKHVRGSSSSPRRAAEWARAFGVLGLLAGLYAAMGGASLLFLLELYGLLLLGGAALHLFGPRAFNADRTLSRTFLEAGGTITVHTELTFSSWLPVPWLLAEDRWNRTCRTTLLFPGFRRKLSFDYELNGIQRGRHRLELGRAVWGDLPGWFTGSRETGDGPELLVTPAPLYYSPGPLALADCAGAAVRRGRGEGEESDIRSYRPGDPLSRVHWKSSARRGELLTRETERERSRMLCIVLDNNAAAYQPLRPPAGTRAGTGAERLAPAPAFELAVSAAMGLLRTAERERAYTQLFAEGWPEQQARYEGLGRIPERVLAYMAEVAPGGSRSLAALLEEASRQCLPGMSLAVVTGRLERSGASALARLLAQGVEVQVYYAWDEEAPAAAAPGEAADAAWKSSAGIGESLRRLGAVLYRLDQGQRRPEGGGLAWAGRGQVL
ncbi:DUF58 domain-containing protein [Paenibacillus glufosinatiresistens]|uniref:DUF58 domain-containing protein n=1 Tax=Paenibacillus glufosinatiresistens TaxID=3070657 RepID=UPI00286DE546|nr:DUF58 domain-containing protein [Paenibacillus sp. YX.27]